MRRVLCVLLTLLLLSSIATGEEYLRFSALDLDGNTVTEEVFAAHELTLVNLWATWCKWCAWELPYLPSVVRQLPDEIGFITVCTDAQKSAQTAADMLAEAGADFVTLCAVPELTDPLTRYTHAVPATFFVDRDGRIVGEPIVGVPSTEEDVADRYVYIAKQRLKAMG